CHAPTVARRLGTAPFAGLDVLELFAFTRPASACLPTAAGIAAALDLPRPASLEEEALVLRRASELLIAEIGTCDALRDGDALAIAQAMRDGGWGWGPAVCAALSHLADPAGRAQPRRGLNVWVRLLNWSEYAPEPPPES